MKNINVYVISNIGNVRENHEDNFYIPEDKFINESVQKEIRSSDTNVEYEYKGNTGVFAVCDGMGGHCAGEVASRIAVENIASEQNKLVDGNKEQLLNFIKELNDKICDYGETHVNCNNMGSTFSAVIVSSNGINTLHVGDSRIYKYVDDKLEQISIDHTEGVRLVAAGILKKENLDKFPNRKSLYKYLGRKGELVADCEKVEGFTKGKIIIASDGLSDTLGSDEIISVLRQNSESKEICHKLIEECLKKGEKCTDNVTIVVMDIY